MKQLMMIIAMALFLVTVPALSSAGDRYRNSEGFQRHRSATVFEPDRHEQRHDDGAQFRAHRERGEKKVWKGSKRHARFDKVSRHRHESQRHWRHNRHRHLEPPVVYRYAPPRRSIVRERVVVTPVFPVPLPPRLVLHFSF